MKLRQAWSQIARICRDEAIDFNVRYAAMRACCKLADREPAARLMLELTGQKVHQAVRGQAATHLAELGHIAAVPRILELLEAKESIVRARADAAMRAFAQKPEGVGYRSHGGPDEARRWRQWWATTTQRKAPR